MRPYLGRRVRVVVDRPVGSRHPRFAWRYPLNYGFLPDTTGGDGAPIDAYVLDVAEPVPEALGTVVAVVLREDDVEDKLVVSPSGTVPARKDVEQAVRFQERFFRTRIVLAAPAWVGAAGRCFDVAGRVLLVLQGRGDGEKSWAIPGGGRNPGETLEACCAREVWEETGYHVVVGRQLHLKTGVNDDQPFELHIFAATVTGGEPALHDPDGLIHQVAWCSRGEVQRLPFCFPEDRGWLLERMTGA